MPVPSTFSRISKRTAWGALAGLSATAVVLTGCAPGGSGVAESDTTFDCATAEDAATTASELTVFTGEGTRPFTQGLADAFMEKYPDITVTLQAEADNNYNTVVPRLLASDNPPDVIAPADLIGAVTDNLIVNLDGCETAFGWGDEIPSSVLAAGRVQDGVIGSGSLYSAGGAAGPLVGVFYNRALAQQVGLTEIPQSIDEMTTALQAVKDSGVTPIVASNSDGLTGHLFNLLLGSYMGPQNLLDVVWRVPGATLDTDAAREAAGVLQDWAQRGFFNADANAINQDASYGQFASGQGLFLITGTWATQALPDDFAGQYGIFPFPSATAGGQQVSMTGNQLATSIAAKSDNKAAAALYLDFLSSPEAAAVALENGYPSAITGGDVTPVSLDQDLETQIQNGYATIAEDNGFDSWLNNSTPEVNTAMTTQLQAIIGGQTTGDDMIAALESTYQSSLTK